MLQFFLSTRCSKANRGILVPQGGDTCFHPGLKSPPLATGFELVAPDFQASTVSLNHAPPKLLLHLMGNCEAYYAG